MAGFVQIIECTASRIDEVEALSDQFREDPVRPGGPVRLLVVADRDKPNTYRTVVEFESHDSAMANSARDDTSAFAQKMAALCDGPPTFFNGDVVHQM